MSRELISTGCMCERIQYSPGKIGKCAEQLKVVPELILNGVRYYSIEDETQIFEFLNAQKKQANKHKALLSQSVSALCLSVVPKMHEVPGGRKPLRFDTSH